MNTHTFHFTPTVNSSSVDVFKQAWRDSLLAPQDGMWEILTEAAQDWEISTDEEPIGYASVDEGGKLLQFFLLPFWIQDGAEIFQQFIQQEKIEKALIGTHNPICLSIAIQVQKSVKVDTCLFTDHLTVQTLDKAGVFRSYGTDDPEKLIDFYHENIEAPKDWLRGYLGGHLAKGEIFVLVEGGEILGACEVRKSDSQAGIADLGMVVSAKHRKKGLGTYLLGKAKEVALSWGKQPICSCEKANIGSLKSIQNNGFRSIHQMLLLSF